MKHALVFKFTFSYKFVYGRTQVGTRPDDSFLDKNKRNNWKETLNVLETTNISIFLYIMLFCWGAFILLDIHNGNYLLK